MQYIALIEIIFLNFCFYFLEHSYVCYTRIRNTILITENALKLLIKINYKSFREKQQAYC